MAISGSRGGKRPLPVNIRLQAANGYRQFVRPLGCLLVLAGYWAPWVAHRDAGLAIAAVDLVEFPKFMPQYRSGELSVWREAFYVPLFVLAAALVVWSALDRGATWWRWVLRACALFIPLTPSVFNVLESHEFQTQLNMTMALGALIVLTPLWRRLPPRVLQAVLFSALALGIAIPVGQFLFMLPALSQIYAEPIGIGWGLWANVLGFALLAFSLLSWKESANG